MPARPAIPATEQRLGQTIVTAVAATSWKVLRTLGLETLADGGGALLKED